MIDLQIQQLTYFVTVAEQGSINKAAEKLFVTQPNLSKAISNLESELKVRIFDRTNKGVILTDDGKKLYQYARTILNQMELIQGLSSRERPRILSIASYPIITMGRLIGAFYNNHKQEEIALKLVEQRMQQVIESDPEVSPWLKTVMVCNYNVTLAEKLIPACDISQQISLASKEASGTGNMKFMLNGAITLGTEDGANVEIHQLVCDSNIYVFGDSSQTVIQRYKDGSYRSRDFYEKDPVLRQAVDFITGPEMMAAGCPENLNRLSQELLNKDWFMTFPDFEAYLSAREQAFHDYEDRYAWAKKMLVNISQAGFFSSDRTIAQYNKDIWKL